MSADSESTGSLGFVKTHKSDVGDKAAVALLLGAQTESEDLKCASKFNWIFKALVCSAFA